MTTTPPNKPLHIVTLNGEKSALLRKRAPHVHGFDQRALTRLVERMHTALRASHGLGIAAPQIGESAAVCSVLLLPDDYQPEALTTARALVLINPELIKRSVAITTADEACLSVPDFVVQRVPRAEAVVVQYKNMAGVTKRVAATGLIARILQHELDHLQGTLIVDYMQAQEDIRLATNTGM